MLSRTAGVFLLVLIVGFAVDSKVVVADFSDYNQEIEREFRFLPGGSLSLSNSKGQIEISGWEEDRLEITVLKSMPKDMDPAKAREWLERVKVEITLIGDEIKIVTRCADKLPVDVSYWILVPKRTDVRVNSLKSYVMIENIEGDIEVSVLDGSMLLHDLAGNLELSLVNGPIHLEELKGTLSISTISGNIQAQVAGLDSSEMLTVSGKVTVSLPSSAAVNLEAATLEGDIEVAPQFIIDRYSDDRQITGKLNGGGQWLAICSLNGKIVIEVL